MTLCAAAVCNRICKVAGADSADADWKLCDYYALRGCCNFVIEKYFSIQMLPTDQKGNTKDRRHKIKNFCKNFSLLIKNVWGPGFNKFGLKNFFDLILDKIIFYFLSS